jgi:hypothetical protein
MINVPEAGSGEGAQTRPEIEVVVNWLEEFRQKMPPQRGTR